MLPPLVPNRKRWAYHWQTFTPPSAPLRRRSVAYNRTAALTEDYKPVIVAYRNGNPITIGDVAKVVDGVEDDQVSAWFNGSRSILLAIFRQPDANTIDVVDSVKALVPTFRAQIPASVDLSVMFDRSVSIRQAVDDVQYTLMLTVGLVVLVIFLFLRNVTATLIPALALPISVVGTFGGMYLMGYSIDNLSLLALTLSVGFVVDDAIVMLENIVRHIEDGMKPFEAALKGSREIGFTILSITCSLLAVFIPVLFMGGIVGRLFREFAVTISMTILISGFVSLTLTPMLCSRLLRPVDHSKKQNALYRWSESVFDGMLALYMAVLRLVLRFRFMTLMATFVTLAITIYLYAIVPKGFFPIEDTGQIYGKTEASQDISFDAMAIVQKQAADVIAADPAVDLLNSSIGVTGSSTAINQGSFFIALKPMEERKISATEIIQRLRPKLAKIPGINTYLQPVQNINVGGRLAKSLYQYTVQGTDLQEVQHWSPMLEEKLQQIPGLQDVSSDLQISSPQAYVDIDRQKAATLGVTIEAIQSTLYSAFGSRQVSTIYTPSNEYEVILELDPRYAKDIQALSSIYVPATGGGPGPSRRGRAGRAHGGAVERRSPGRAALGDAVLQPPPRHVARRCGAEHPGDGAEHEPARHHQHELPGHGAGLPGFAARPGASPPGGGLRDLCGAGHSLRELHPPDHHPVRPSLGRHWSAFDADALPHGSDGDRDYRHHHADRHREEERDHDDRLRAGSAAAGRGIAGTRDLRGLLAQVPADHDDDHGGDHGDLAHSARRGSGIGASPAPGRGGRGRVGDLAAADALHHPGGLSLSGAGAALPVAPGEETAGPGRTGRGGSGRVMA